MLLSMSDHTRPTAAQEPAQEPAQDIAQEPVQETVQEPSQDPVETPVREPEFVYGTPPPLHANPGAGPTDSGVDAKRIAMVTLGVLGFLGVLAVSFGGGGNVDGSRRMMAGIVGNLVAIVAVAVSGGLYALPTLIAWRRKSRDVMAIGALNLFLGWTFVGWVIALVWSLRASDRATR